MLWLFVFVLSWVYSPVYVHKHRICEWVIFALYLSFSTIYEKIWLECMCNDVKMFKDYCHEKQVFETLSSPHGYSTITAPWSSTHTNPSHKEESSYGNQSMFKAKYYSSKTDWHSCLFFLIMGNKSLYKWKCFWKKCSVEVRISQDLWSNITHIISSWKRCDTPWSFPLF